jgi:transposase
MDIETLLKNPNELRQLILQNDSIIKRYESELIEKDSIISNQNQIILNNKIELDSNKIELDKNKIELDKNKIELDKNKIELDKKTKEIELQKTMIETLRQAIFDRKSEKVVRENPRQNLLFNEVETYLDRKEIESVEIPSHKRKKAGRKPIPNNVPREIIVNDLGEEDKTCSCGCKLNKIGVDIKEDLEYIPAKVYVTRTETPKYVCRSCSRKKADVEIKKAPPKSVPLIEKSIVTPSLLAAILYQKFFLALPYYRQSKLFEHLGYNISRTDMCNWTIKVYEKYMKDFFNLFWKYILTKPHMHIDETRLKVLIQKNKEQKNCFMWVVASNDVVLFDYRETRGAEFLREHLASYSGSITTDGYESYATLLQTLPEITHSGCFAHVRRKFLENKTEFKSSKTAKEIIYLIRKMYRIERWIKNLKLSNEDIIQIRTRWSSYYLNKIKGIVDINYPNVSSGTYIGNGISYIKNQWSKLIKFIDNPNIPIDNNFVENKIRPFVVGRKN